MSTLEFWPADPSTWPVVPIGPPVTSFTVSPSAARFFGLDQTQFMRLKARRRLRKDRRRVHAETRAWYKHCCGRHDRWLEEARGR